MSIGYGFKINLAGGAWCLVPRICEFPASSGLGASMNSWSPAGAEEPGIGPAVAVLLAHGAECRLRLRFCLRFCLHLRSTFRGQGPAARGPRVW